MKKLLSTILASAMILSMSVTSFAVENNVSDTQAKAIISGNCEGNVTWIFDTNTGTMTIQGTGVAWNPFVPGGDATEYKSEVKKLVFGTGITDVYGFYSMDALTTLEFGDTVERVGIASFENSPSLTTVYIGKSLKEFGESVFYQCNNIKTVYFSSSKEEAELSYFGQVGSFDSPSTQWIYNTPMPSTGSTPTVTPVPEATYPDWMSSFIDFVADDIMPDISPENYSFASNRGLIAQSLYNMCGDGGTYTSNFTDTGANASAIGWCFENGVMAGSSETWFNAEGNVTREQFALILLQLATVQGFDVSYDLGILSDYPDGTSGNDWAQSGLAWAVKNGLMTGNSDGSLNPIGDVSRVEVAVMLSNFVNLG